MKYKNFPIKKYDVIVVDPPWMVKKLTHRTRPNQVNMDYSTLSIEDIKELPINNISTSNSWLFLWTTQKFLFSALSILEKWEFKHLLTMAWKKTYGISEGMPLFGFRWNCEFILVGYKTKPKLWASKKLIPACFEAPNIKHSKKPDKFYELIYSLGNTHIDIFARASRFGWDVWGDEV